MKIVAECVHRQESMKQLHDFYEDQLIAIVYELCSQDVRKLQRYLMCAISEVFTYNVIVAAQMAQFERFFAQKPILGKHNLVLN